MKKLGFTLAEILIAMGILGVIAALTMPTIHKLSPDKDKGMVLKAYKTITEINNEILNDPSLYMLNTKIYGTNNNCTNILACTSKPVDGQHETGYEGDAKYPHLLSDHLTLSKNYTINSGSPNSYEFTTPDGLEWLMFTINSTSDDIFYFIMIDTKNPARQNCSYSKNTCKNPRSFLFKVEKNGAVTYADNLTRVYLENPDNLTERYADLAKAATY